MLVVVERGASEKSPDLSSLFSRCVLSVSSCLPSMNEFEEIRSELMMMFLCLFECRMRELRLELEIG